MSRPAPKPPALDDAIPLAAVDTLRLTGPRILVKRDPPATQIGSILIPETSQAPTSRCCTGVVVQVGPGQVTPKGHRWPVSVEPGERVMFGFLDGHDVTQGNQPYVIIEDREIRAVMT